jgi:hypothetical protein
VKAIIDKLGKLTPRQQSTLLECLFGKLFIVPFGSLGKRDLETLLLHAIFETKAFENSSNRELSNLLGINETKLKSYLLDIRYKYQEDRSEINIRNVIAQILNNKNIKLSHESSEFSFVLENPVLRADLDTELKRLGYYADASFNKEVVRIKDYVLIAFMFHHYDDTFAGLSDLLKQNGATQKDLLKVIQTSNTWPEIAIGFMKKAQDFGGPILLLVDLAKLLKGVPAA